MTILPWSCGSSIGNRHAGYTSGFPAALSLMSVCLLAQGFHNSGTVPNPQDLAPKHSGTVFGVMNGIGCIPGRYRDND